MSLKSPQKIIHPYRIAIGNLEVDYSHHDSVNDITSHGTIPLIYFGTEELKKGGSASVIMNYDHPIPDNIVLDYIRFQNLINNCINNAEDIKRRLVFINKGLFGFTPEERMTISTHDFMKLKDNFLDYARKHEPTKSIANKALRKDFNQFVIDRNIYTHGKLKVRYSDKAYILEYIDNSTKQTSHAVINEQIIRSYYQSYIEIKNLISLYHSSQQ